MKRLLISLVWVVIFVVVVVLGASVHASARARAAHPTIADRAGREAVKKLLEQYGLPMLVGSAVCALVLAGCGVLPGTGSRMPDSGSTSERTAPQGRMQLSSMSFATRTMCYFNARIPSMFFPSYVHRVYVVGDDLFFINLGVTTLDPTTISQRTMVAVGGGLLPALVVWAAAADTQDQLDKMERMLAGASEAQIREYLAKTRKGFELSLSDVKCAVLENKDFFDFAGPECKAILRLKHARRGEMALHLLNMDDMSTAANEFVSRLGDRLVCKV